MLRGPLAEQRPGDSVLGEEFGGTAAFAGRQWVIDPIDGTKNFVRGVPVWATLIALLDDGVPVVGVVSAPALGRRWWAAQGEGAFTSSAGDATRLRVSGVGDLGSASLSLSDLTTGWEGAAGSRLPRFHRRGVAGARLRRLLVVLPGGRGCRRHRREPEVKLWDLAPLDLLVREAGGRFTDSAAEPGPHGGSAVATNGLLHDAVLARVASA